MCIYLWLFNEYLWRVIERVIYRAPLIPAPGPAGLHYPRAGARAVVLAHVALVHLLDAAHGRHLVLVLLLGLGSLVLGVLAAAAPGEQRAEAAGGEGRVVGAALQLGLRAPAALPPQLEPRHLVQLLPSCSWPHARVRLGREPTGKLQGGISSSTTYLSIISIHILITCHVWETAKGKSTV